MSEEEESWDDEALLREIEMQLNEIETDEEEELERDVTEERRPPPDQSSEEISEAWNAFHTSIARSNAFIENVDRETKEVNSLLSSSITFPKKIETDSENKEEDDADREIEEEYKARIEEIEARAREQQKRREEKIRLQKEAKRKEVEMLRQIEEERQRWENEQRERLRRLREEEERRQEAYVEDRLRTIRKSIAGRTITNHFARRYLNRSRHAILIQTLFRRFECQRSYLVFRKTERSRITIQRTARGMIGRMIARRTRETQRLERIRLRKEREKQLREAAIEKRRQIEAAMECASHASRAAKQAARDAVCASRDSKRIVMEATETAFHVCLQSAVSAAKQAAECAVKVSENVQCRVAALRSSYIASYAARECFVRVETVSSDIAALNACDVATDAAKACTIYVETVSTGVHALYASHVASNAADEASNVARNCSIRVAALCASDIAFNAAGECAFSVKSAMACIDRMKMNIVDLPLDNNNNNNNDLSNSSKRRRKKITVVALRDITSRNRALEIAATKIQSMFRASRTRVRLDQVKESAKYADDDTFEYEDIDIDAFLADVSDTNEFFNENENNDLTFVEEEHIIDSKEGTHDVPSFRKDRDLPPRPRRYGWGDNEKDEDSVSEQKTQTFPQRLQAAAPPQQQQRHVKEIVREWGFQDKKTAKLLLKRRKRMMKGKKKNMQQHKERRRLKRRVGLMMRTQDERRIRQRDRHRLPKLVSPTVSVSSSGSGSSGSTISRSRNRTPPRTSQSWAGSEKRRQRKEALTRCIHESNAIKNRLMGNARRFLLDEDDDDEFSLPPISRSR